MKLIQWELKISIYLYLFEYMQQADDSYMDFEGTSFVGKEAIMGKLKSLPFKTIQHVITKIDCQPSGADRVLILSYGQVKVWFYLYSDWSICLECIITQTDDEPPHNFSEVFVLVKKSNENNYMVQNNIFVISGLSK